MHQTPENNLNGAKLFKLYIASLIDDDCMPFACDTSHILSNSAVFRKPMAYFTISLAVWINFPISLALLILNLDFSSSRAIAQSVGAAFE